MQRLGDMNEFEVSEIGSSLVFHSQEQEISGRGIVSALFPYIYMAAKRMSTRSISAFLLEKHGVKLSAVTIAKALREPEKHVSVILERVEPAARIVASAHNMGAEELLRQPNAFEVTLHEKPEIWVGSTEETQDTLHEYEAARELLAREWFELPTDLRLMTLSALERQKSEEVETDAK